MRGGQSSGPRNCFSFGILESILYRSRDVLVALDVEVGGSIPRSFLGAGRPPWGAAEEGKIQVRSESSEAGTFPMMDSESVRSDGSALMAGSDRRSACLEPRRKNKKQVYWMDACVMPLSPACPKEAEWKAGRDQNPSARLTRQSSGA
jgi:hypothetical protein